MISLYWITHKQIVNHPQYIILRVIDKQLSDWYTNVTDVENNCIYTELSGNINQYSLHTEVWKMIHRFWWTLYINRFAMVHIHNAVANIKFGMNQVLNTKACIRKFHRTRHNNVRFLVKFAMIEHVPLSWCTMTVSKSKFISTLNHICVFGSKNFVYATWYTLAEV